MTELQNFTDADMSFYAESDSSCNPSFYLHEGDEIYDEIEDNYTDKEILKWAKEIGYLAEEMGYINEDGSVDIESLREARLDEDRIHFEEYPPSNATPSGRAFLWFNDLNFSFPPEIDIEIVDGPNPGNVWQGVIVKDYESLVRVQSFLLSKGIKVNFDVA